MSKAVAHSCIICQSEFLVDDMVELPISTIWQTISSSGKPVTMDDLTRFSEAGCDFAKYVAEKLVQKNGKILPDTTIVRYPAAHYEEYENSFLIGLPNREYVHFMCMVDGGEK